MLLNSLDDYVPASARCVVLMESSATYPALDVVVENALFGTDASEVGSEVGILVDPDPELVEETLTGRSSAVELWFPRNRIGRLHDVLMLFDAWAVNGLHLTENWIHLAILPATASSRSSADFRAGLQAVQRTAAVPSIVNGENVPPINVRSLLIAELVPLVKPYKRYIPHRVVIAMYKILEKIR
ncbi:hypothetical protein [Corynebacterium epidermidicanis]|uniref:Uncharacterized protein n=1 Tax=Corynebacterium epidermidicanis TaxID=1050174 RepID=A0A0G3GR21_9CORY|nr:hypothetical protein [Corynebacterium epidermidicanis]AKK02028.1 hypothetical protein CEPID_00670 [Corynebacterium epidermidicanis]